MNELEIQPDEQDNSDLSTCCYKPVETTEGNITRCLSCGEECGLVPEEDWREER